MRCPIRVLGEAAAMSRLLAPWWWEARPSIAPSGASWRAISNGLSPKSHALERSASSPARKKPFWWQPPAPSLLRGAPAGHWSCWLARWSSSPTTRACRMRRFAGDWPKTTSSPGARTCGASPGSMANMSPAWKTCSTFTPKHLIPSGRWVCFDESPVQLIGEVRQPIPATPGQLERYDYEYRRNGTVNLFVFLDANRPWRKVKVTERRTAEDYAQCMRELVDVHYPNADTIRVVQDNLSSHSAGALYQTFDPAEARRILRRLEFHYTPKHASWLNMVEIEIGVLRGQCLDRRIDHPEDLNCEIGAWERQRNATGARIKWMFTT